MRDRFGKDRDELFSVKKREYLKLGEQLKELTRAKIAEKFLVDRMAITAVSRIDVDDFVLINDLLKERATMTARRKYLRRKYYV